MFVLTEKERKKSSVFKGLNEYLKKKITWISKTCFIISTKYKKEIANTSTPCMNCNC